MINECLTLPDPATFDRNKQGKIPNAPPLSDNCPYIYGYVGSLVKHLHVTFLLVYYGKLKLESGRALGILFQLLAYFDWCVVPCMVFASPSFFCFLKLFYRLNLTENRITSLRRYYNKFINFSQRENYCILDKPRTKFVEIISKVDNGSRTINDENIGDGGVGMRQRN